MQTLKFKIEKKETTEVEVEIPVPSFFRNKSETEYVAILDDGSILEIIADDFEKSVRNYSGKNVNYGKDRIHNAYNNFHSCTESEFLENLDKVTELITSKTAA